MKLFERIRGIKRCDLVGVGVNLEEVCHLGVGLEVLKTHTRHGLSLAVASGQDVKLSATSPVPWVPPSSLP